MSARGDTLRLHDVRVRVAGGDTVLDGVSLVAQAGRMVAVSGPSGSGKTTLLSVAGGLLLPDRGEAVLGERPAWRGSGDPHPDTAFVLQVYGLVAVLTARENVAVALQARGVPAEEAARSADDALSRVGVGDLGDRLVDELSGGQLQRVACARALVVLPALLLADEPTSELDELSRDRVLGELRREADRGAVVLVATHDRAVTERCDGEYRLVDGRVAATSGIASAADVRAARSMWSVDE